MVTTKNLLTNFLFPLFFLLLPGCCQTEKVKTLTIVRIGQTVTWSQKDVAMDAECKQFRPTREQIMRFFNRAHRVLGKVVTEERYSPCFAEGLLTWADGTRVSWTLYSSGTAVIELVDGENTHLLDRSYYWYDPLKCSYGLEGGEGEC